MHRSHTNKVHVWSNVYRVPIPRCGRWPASPSIMELSDQSHVPIILYRLNHAWSNNYAVYAVTVNTSCICNTFTNILSSRSFNDISPLIWVKQLGLEHWSKVFVIKIRWIVVLHELHKIQILSGLPVVPEPCTLTAVSRHCIETPGDEHTKFSFIKPWWEWPSVERVPVWLIPSVTLHQWPGQGQDYHQTS